jgi:hypothetical protein
MCGFLSITGLGDTVEAALLILLILAVRRWLIRRGGA